MEVARKYQSDNIIAFVDLMQAFDRLGHNRMCGQRFEGRRSANTQLLCHNESYADWCAMHKKQHDNHCTLSGRF